LVVRVVLALARFRLCDCVEPFAAESVFEMAPLTAVIVAGGVATRLIFGVSAEPMADEGMTLKVWRVGVAAG